MKKIIPYILSLFSFLPADAQPSKHVFLEPYAKQEQQYDYRESILDVLARDYERLPYPAELFSVYFAGLEGKLRGDDLVAFKNMQHVQTEWLGVVVLKEGNTVHCYEDTKNLIRPTELRMDFAGNLAEWWFTGDKLRYNRYRRFSLPSVPENDLVSVTELPEPFVVYVFSRSYKEFPPLQEAPKVQIPKTGGLWPLARSGTWVVLGGGYSPLCDAARGVRQK